MVSTPIKPGALTTQFNDSPESNSAEAPQTVQQTVEWVSQVLKLSVMPECPVEAAKVWGEKSAKRPCYWDEVSQKVKGLTLPRFKAWDSPVY